MANDSFTQAALAADPHFFLRVRSALDSIAWQVQGEDPGTVNHANRVAYARQVVRSLDSETRVIMLSIVHRPNVINFATSYQFDFPLQVGQVVSASTDADLLSQVATDWDALAAAAGFVTAP
jgi:hypothetical protein